MEKDQAIEEAWKDTLKEVQKALKKKGVTYDLIASRIKQGLNAKETHCKFDGGQFGSNQWEYSKGLVAHGARLGWARLAAELLDIKPAERHEFPDENGKPQNLGAAFGDTERSARLIYLLETAEKRAKEAKCK